MSQRTLNGTIALDRLITVIMTKKNKAGQPIKGIFIPLELNKLEEVSYETQGGMVNEIQLPIRVIVKETEKILLTFSQHGISNLKDVITLCKMDYIIV